MSGKIKFAFVLMSVIFFLVLIGFARVVNDVSELTKENEARIADIQSSRTESCKQTYRGIREVFRPFFPKEPRTQKQKKDLSKFNTTITKLQQGCTKQTKS